MNTIFSHSKFFLLMLCSLLPSCIALSQNLLPNPKIERGIARISGQVNNLPASIKYSDISVKCNGYNLLTGLYSHETTLNSENQFHLDIPLETSVTIAGFHISIDSIHTTYTIGLNTAKELILDITLEEGTIKMASQGGLELSNEDMIDASKSAVAFYDLINIIPPTSGYYKMSPKEFAENEINSVLPTIIDKSISPLKLSGGIKTYLTNTFSLEYIKGRVFWYKEEAERSYKLSKDTVKYIIVEPSKSYYSFLRRYDLNDLQKLYAYTYPSLLKSLLNIKALDIPRIEDSSIESWLDEVKSKIKDIVGFDSGLFYDLLAANEYILQLSYRNDSLSNKQITHIKNYSWEQKGIIDILLQRDEELRIQLANSKSLNICKVPSVPKEKLMESIISKYKGKVVIADFWATWCSPCLMALQNMKALESSTRGNLTHIYFTNGSSPKKLWDKKIKEIGGQHYYLKEDIWEKIMTKYSFTGIPSYLIFDEKGELKYQFTGYPGNRKMDAMIKR